MIKTINPLGDMHVVIDTVGDRNPVVVAADLARQLDAHLTGVTLAYEPIMPVYSAADPMIGDFIVSAHEQATADAEAGSAVFQKAASAAGIKSEVRGLQSIIGDGFAVAMSQLRITDLVVVGQDSADQKEPMRAALIENILFQAGAPTLLVPNAGVTAFKPTRVVIAWNGSIAAARAVRSALPVLQLAETVQVVMVEEARANELSGVEIGEYLARHDLDVDVQRIDNTEKDIGATLLAFASREKADWMVMGAYGHSRMREFLLGGATRNILATAAVPVLMAH
jgi:nucleotide-binding universal stress UspA family protein